jgi:hypothetical protein
MIQRKKLIMTSIALFFLIILANNSFATSIDTNCNSDAAIITDFKSESNQIKIYDKAITCANTCSMASTYLHPLALQCYSLARFRIEKGISITETNTHFNKPREELLFEIDTNGQKIIQEIINHNKLGPQIMTEEEADSNFALWSNQLGQSAFNLGTKTLFESPFDEYKIKFLPNLNTTQFYEGTKKLRESIINYSKAQNTKSTQKSALVLGVAINEWQKEAVHKSFENGITQIISFLQKTFLQLILFLIFYCILITLLFVFNKQIQKKLKKRKYFGIKTFNIFDNTYNHNHISAWGMTKFIAMLWVGVTIAFSLIVSYWEIILQMLSSNSFAIVYLFSTTTLYQIAFFANEFYYAWIVLTVALFFSFFWVAITFLKLEQALWIIKYLTYVCLAATILIITLPILAITTFFVILIIFSFLIAVPPIYLIFIYNQPKNKNNKVLICVSGKEFVGKIEYQDETTISLKIGKKIIHINKSQIDYHIDPAPVKSKKKTKKNTPKKRK